MLNLRDRDNEKIRQLVDINGWELPKYFVGDKVRLFKNAESLVKSTYYFKVYKFAWQRDSNTFLYRNIDKSLTIIEKYKHNINEPWWSLLRDDMGFEMFFLDITILPNIPDYTPRRKKIKEHYQYRFKTKAEFIKEFGENWI